MPQKKGRVKSTSNRIRQAETVKKISHNCDFLKGPANNWINTFHLKHRKMKNLEVYAFVTFLCFGTTSISAQNMLDLYLGYNKDSLTNEVAIGIHTPTEPAFTVRLGFVTIKKRGQGFGCRIKSSKQANACNHGKRKRSLLVNSYESSISKNSYGKLQMIN